MRSMKPMDYHLFDVIFVIESTASNGAYLNEMKTNYIHPALEYFSNGLEDSNLYGIVLFKTSQCAPMNTCSTYGPFNAQKFLKTIDGLELTGGRSESNANLAEGLATALNCFQDLEKRRDKDSQIHKHCILILNSQPYSMPVTECYEYEGKTVEQLASIFSEKNINLSILSPRKIPILFEIFEKSGGDMGVTAKNYSKDPRHLVLLKGFSLKELIHDKPADSPVTQISQVNSLQNQQQQQSQQQQPQVQTQIPQQPQPQAPIVAAQIQANDQMMQMQGQMMQGGAQNIRQMNPNIRANNPMVMQTGPQQQNQQAVMNQGMGNSQQFAGPMGNFPQQQRPNNPQQNPQQASNMGQQRWMAPNQPNQVRPNQFMQQQQQQQQQQVQNNMINPNMMQNQNTPQQNSALISQLTQPPSAMNPSGAMLPQQQQQQNMAIRMAMQNQNSMQNNPQMMGNNPQQNQQQAQGMMQPNQTIPPQMSQQAPQQQQPMGQQNQMAPREKIWRGILEWNDKQNQQNQVRQVPCEIYATISKETNEPEIRGDTWPQRLIMQLMPRTVISSVGGQMLRDAKVVLFQFANSEPFESLSKVMANGFAGCVHFTNNHQQQCDVKILILLYMNDKKSYYGFVPNDQAAYVEKLRRVIQQSKIGQVQGQMQGQFGQNQPGPQQNQPNQMQPVQPQQQQQQPGNVGIVGGGPRPNMMGMGMQQGNPMGGNQNVGNMMQNQQTDQNMMFNQQMQMQGNQQRMTRPNMLQNNNLRHLLQQQQQTQFRPQMGGPQQQQQQQNPQMQHAMDQQYDMNF